MLRKLAIIALLSLVAVVTLAPRTCGECGVERISNKFEDQAFVMEVVSIRIDRSNGTMQGTATITPVGEHFRSDGELVFSAKVDRAAGTIEGRGKFRYSGEIIFDDDIDRITATGTMSFLGSWRELSVFDIVGSGRYSGEVADGTDI